MTAKFTLAALGLLSAVAATSATAASDVPDTHIRSLAAGCATCHPATVSGAIPYLGNRGRDALAQRLHDFRDGKTPATVMHQIVRGYTDEELDRIAAYLSATPTSSEP